MPSQPKPPSAPSRGSSLKKTLTRLTTFRRHRPAPDAELQPWLDGERDGDEHRQSSDGREPEAGTGHQSAARQPDELRPAELHSHSWRSKADKTGDGQRPSTPVSLKSIKKLSRLPSLSRRRKADGEASGPSPSSELQDWLPRWTSRGDDDKRGPYVGYKKYLNDRQWEDLITVVKNCTFTASSTRVCDRSRSFSSRRKGRLYRSLQRREAKARYSASQVRVPTMDRRQYAAYVHG